MENCHSKPSYGAHTHTYSVTSHSRPASPMRIEAIADDHFIFQRCEHDNYYDVVVLHRDAFDVAPRPKQWFHAEGYEERFDNRFCSTGESDEDEDEDEEGGP